MSHETIRRIHGGGFEGAHPPERWSFTRLQTLEACPRRYWLRHAKYDFMKPESGYPRWHSTASILGTTAHRSVELVLNALQASPSTPPVEVLRQLGGLRDLVQRVADDTLGDLASNPRMAPRLESLRHAVQRRLDATVTLVQQALRRLATDQRAGPKPDSDAAAVPASRWLRRGSYTEIGVQHSRLPIAGVIDHLQIGDGTVRITDFKTGRASPEHLDQLLIYGVIWRGDARNNSPGAVMTLVAEYGDHRTERSVGGDDLDDGEAHLTLRLESAGRSLTEDPPATLESGVCRHCDVRHLCDGYWSDVVAPSLAEAAEDHAGTDVSGVVIERRSPSAYRVQLPDGSFAALFSGNYQLEVGAEFRAHDLLQLPSDRIDGEEPALQVTSASELFVLA